MTDADVDGSHIRTLLMTFFFKQMRPIIDKGFLYLAQPPLFLIRKGKSRNYIKNEKELENYLLKKIGEDVVVYFGDPAEILPQENNEESSKKNQISGTHLIKFIKLVNKMETLIDSIQKRGMPSLLTTKLIEFITDESTFREKSKTEEIAERIRSLGFCTSVDISFEQEHSSYIVELEYEFNGVMMHRSINWDYLTGPLFARVNECHEKLREFPEPPFVIFNGKEKITIPSKKRTGSSPIRKNKKRVLYPTL